MQRNNRILYRPHREAAKRKILKAVNKHRPKDDQLGRRHIYKAVRIARVNDLVSNKTLIAAGFNPVKERGN